MSKIAKLLSLVLAIVMVLSLAVAAADYTDIDDLTKAEKTAVADVTKYGIMQGTGNGFNPDGLLTREQMAKVIYITVTGKQDPGAIYAGFLSEIPDGAEVSDWAKNYVGYAYINGILKGDNNGNINPLGNVTYIEAAIMLLRALGKEGMVELADGTKIPRYTGADWDKNALADALDLDLFANVDVANFKEAMPRKAIAVMTVNTINEDIADCIAKSEITDDDDEKVKDDKLAKLACHTASAQANLVEVKAIVTGWKYDKTAKKNYFLFNGAETIGEKYEIADLSVVDELIGKEVRFVRNGKKEIVEELTVLDSKSSTTDELNKFSVAVKTTDLKKNTLSYKGADGKTVKLLDGKFDFAKSYVIRDGEYVGQFDVNDVDRMNVLKNTFRVNDEVTVVVNENGSVTFYYDVVRLAKKDTTAMKCGRIYDDDAEAWTNEFYFSIGAAVTFDGEDYTAGEGETWFFVDKDFYDEYWTLVDGDVIAAQISYSYATEHYSIDFVDAIEEIDVADLSITKKGTTTVTYTIKNGEDTLVYKYMGAGIVTNLEDAPFVADVDEDGENDWTWYGNATAGANLEGFLVSEPLYTGTNAIADAAAIYTINGGSGNEEGILYVYNNVILGGEKNAILKDPVYAIITNEYDVTKEGDTNTIVTVQYLDGTEEDLVLVLNAGADAGVDTKATTTTIGSFIQITETIADNKRIKVDSDFDLAYDRYALTLAPVNPTDINGAFRAIALNDDDEYVLYKATEKVTTNEIATVEANTIVYCIDVDGEIEFTLDDIGFEKNTGNATISGEWINNGSLKAFYFGGNNTYTPVVVVVYDASGDFDGFTFPQA